VHGPFALALAAWLAWTAWVVLHYFARPPGELLIFIDGPVDRFPFWREAAYQNARAIAGATLVALAAWGAGALLTRRLIGEGERAERLLVTLATGFSLLGILSFGLAALHLYTPPMMTALIVIGAAAGLVLLWQEDFRITRSAVPSLPAALFGGCVVLAVAVALVGALAPESEYDALWYHLWLPARWMAAGRPVDIVEEYVSLYPLTWDLVGGAAMIVGGPVAAKLLHWACLPLIGVSTYLLATRLVPDARPALAAALAVVTPITIWEATTGYVDLAVTWYVSLSAYALVRYHDSDDRRWLLVSAVVMGGALAIKHLALVAFAVLAVVMAVREWRRGGRLARAARTMLLYGSVALMLPAPWYVRAYATSGNPVFPDLYGVFGAVPPERWSPATERGLQRFKDRFGRARTPQNLLLLPWDATVHAARYGGTLGPLFLILGPAALLGPGVRRRPLVVAAGCAAYVAVWASPVSSLQMRFLIPLVPFLGVLGAEGARRMERAALDVWSWGPLLVTGGVAALLVLNLPPTSGWHEPDRSGWDGWMTHIVRATPAAVVLGAESREAYLGRKVPSYRAWQFMSSLPGDVRVLTFSGGDHLYATRERIRADATLARRVTWEAGAGDERKVLDGLAALGVTHVLFDKRQIEDGTLRALAIGSERIRECCLAGVYEDDRFVVYRVGGGLSGVDAPPGAATPEDGPEAR